MGNLWRAFIRRLPKRVIFENRVYYPQVWFIWWHSVWGSAGFDCCTEVYFSSLEKAKQFVEHNWAPEEKRVKTVVWRSCDDK